MEAAVVRNLRNLVYRGAAAIFQSMKFKDTSHNISSKILHRYLAQNYRFQQINWQFPRLKYSIPGSRNIILY